MYCHDPLSSQLMVVIVPHQIGYPRFCKDMSTNPWLPGQCMCQSRCLRQDVCNISPGRKCSKTHTWWQLCLRQKWRKSGKRLLHFFPFPSHFLDGYSEIPYICLLSLALSSWHLFSQWQKYTSEQGRSHRQPGSVGDSLLTHRDSF